MQKYTFGRILSVLECQNIPQGIRERLENYFFPNWRQQNLSKKLKIEEKIFRIFFPKFSNEVSGRSHSVKNPKESSMLAKRLFSVKIERGFRKKNKLEKVAWKKRRC